MSARNRTRRALVVAGAAVAALVTWAVLGMAGIHPSAYLNGAVQPVGGVAVVVTGLVAGLAGWGLLAVLERAVRRARLVWTVIAALTLLLSLAGPAGAGIGTSGKVALLALHLVVAAVLIPGLGGSARVRLAAADQSR